MYRLFALSLKCGLYDTGNRLGHDRMTHNLRNYRAHRRCLLNELIQKYVWKAPCKIQAGIRHRWACLNMFGSWAERNMKGTSCSLKIR